MSARPDPGASARRYLPKFPLFLQDWLSSWRVQAMTAEQEGGFIRLCLIQWQDGALPGDLALLLRMARIHGSPEDHAILLDAFPIDSDGLRRNGKVARVRAESEDYCDAQASRGRKGNASRWGSQVGSQVGSRKDRTCDAPATPRGSPEDRPPTPTPTPTPTVPSPSETAASTPPPLAQDEPSESADPPKPKRPRKPATGPQAESIRHWESEWARTRLGAVWKWTARHASDVAKALDLAGGDAQEVQTRTTRLLESGDDWTATNASPALLVSRWNQLGVAVVPRGSMSNVDRMLADFQRAGGTFQGEAFGDAATRKVGESA